MLYNPNAEELKSIMYQICTPSVVLTAFLAAVIFFGSPDEAAAETLEKSDTPVFAPSYNSPTSPKMERALNVLAANTTRRGNLLVVIDHRNREPIGDAPFHDLLGFDGGGLKIGLGLRYGLLDNLDLGFYRLNGTVEVFDVYDLDFRYQFLEQEKHHIDMAIRPGVSIFVHRDVDDSTGGFLQLLGTRTFRDRYRVGSGLLYHSESTNDVKTDSDDDYSFAAQAFFEVLLTQSLAWSTEISANLSGYGATNPQVSTALKIRTYKHTFSIVLSNNQYISTDGLPSGTGRHFEDTIIGFTITREIPIGNKW